VLGQRLSDNNMDNISPREHLRRIINGDASAASDIYKLSSSENYSDMLYSSLSYMKDDECKKVLAVFSSAPIEFQNSLHKRAKKASRVSRKNTIISVICLLVAFLLGVQTVFYPTISGGLTVLFCIVFCMAGFINNSHNAQRANEIVASLETAGGAELAGQILMDKKAEEDAAAKRPWQKRPLFWILMAAAALLVITFPLWNPQKIYIRGLIHNMGNTATRGQAFETLSHQTSAAAIGLLIDALKDKDPQIQAASEDALIAIGKPAIEPLIAVSIGNNTSKYEAYHTLIAMGEPAVQPLIAALDNKEDSRSDPELLKAMLNNIGTPAIEPLMAAARQGNPQTQLYAVEILICDTYDAYSINKDKCILGSYPPTGENLSRVTKLLTDLLNDADSSVRLKAVRSLSKAPWMTDQHVPLLANTLAGLLRDTNAFIRSEAVQTLSNAQWMAEQRVPLLITALKDESVSVRYAAAGALGGTNDALAISSLAALLKDKDNGVRVAATYSLAQSGKNGIQALISGLGSGAIEIAARDYPSIIEAGDKTKITVLIAALFIKDDSSMALTYLNCGEMALEGAAEGWARSHGYQLSYTSGQSPDHTWGRP
jgi:HEAT repeat protein